MALPEHVCAALQSVPLSLRSIDSNAWSVGKPRYTWAIEEATTNSPLTFVLLAVLTITDAQPINVAAKFVEGYKQLNSGKRERPSGWTDEDVKRALELGELVEAGASVTVGHGKVKVATSTELARTARAVLDSVEDFAPVIRYGSINGELRQVTGDRLPSLSDLQGLDIDITDGEDSADFVDRMRGEAESGILIPK